jgi:hypothetical protein
MDDGDGDAVAARTQWSVSRESRTTFTGNFHSLLSPSRRGPATPACAHHFGIMARPKITPKKSGSQTRGAAKIQRERKMAQGVKPAHPDRSAATSENEETDNGDEGSEVDEEGLEKLMKALGGDGLDEFDLAQLRMLTGSAEREEGSGQGGEEDSSDGEEDDEDTKSVSDEEHAIGEEEAIALDDEDVHSIDEDAVPRRKIEVDNKVRPRPSLRLPSRLIS